jgi:hypothetical protein
MEMYRSLSACRRSLPSQLSLSLLHSASCFLAINRLCICTPASERRPSADYLVLTSSPLRHMYSAHPLFQPEDDVMDLVKSSVVYHLCSSSAHSRSHGQVTLSPMPRRSLLLATPDCLLYLIQAVPRRRVFAPLAFFLSITLLNTYHSKPFHLTRYLIASITRLFPLQSRIMPTWLSAQRKADLIELAGQVGIDEYACQTRHFPSPF